MNLNRLELTSQALVKKGKGILAADESLPTIQKRFQSIHLDSTQQTRRVYRELLFTTPDLEDAISGVILFEESLHHATEKGKRFLEILAEKGIIPGIKVDKGTIEQAGFSGEKMTQGLDGLRDRLVEYAKLGAKFAKWRAVITIGKNTPSSCNIFSQAHLLARYAAFCQEVDLVPIVEPEVLMEGNHSLETCEEVTSATLKAVFSQLMEHRVYLEGTLLKVNMILPGKTCPDQAFSEEIAEATLRCMRRFVPAAIAGIVFLSGSQSPEQATERLNAINFASDNDPWALSFSYGRALQEPVLNTWKGDDQNKKEAQQNLRHRAKCNSLACLGEYSKSMEAAHTK